MHRHRPIFALLAAAAFGLAATRSPGAPGGLDAIDDEPLLNELAARGLDTLLERAFVTTRTPADRQHALRGRMTLLRLRDHAPPDLTETRRLVAAYVDALPQILPTINDPAALIGDANLLIDHGVAPDQTVLEYFGPSPGAMARLRPAAAAARQLLAKAATQADAAATAATDNWPAREKAWDAADEQKTIATYTRAIVAYPLALATGRADTTREPMIADALAALTPFDSDDNPDRASVKFYAAKLHLARGTPPSLQAAAEGFAYTIAKGRRDDLRQQFDARLLTASVRLAQGQPADAALNDLLAWAKTATIDSQQLDVAVAGLRFRQALAAQRPDAADDELDRLQQKNPALRGLILELISTRLSDSAAVDRLKPLGLQARLVRAEAETLKPAAAAFDRAAVERGVDAAREIRRRGEPADALDATAYVLPYFLQKLGRGAEAAAAFLDYVDTYKAAGKTERVSNAFDQAVATVAALFRQSPDDPAVTRLYDRTLATAVAPPLSRSEFAYEYARRLQAQGKPEAAIAAYRMVPEDDRNYSESRYYLMVAVWQRLDGVAADDSQRPALLTELAGLTEAVDRGIGERLKSPATPQAATIDRTRLVQTRLLAANVALREQKDAARAAGVLDGFESAAQGLANEADLLGEALLIRVQAYVQLGDVGRATDQLVTLAKQNPAGAGQVVYNLLKKLDEQVTAAEAAGRAGDVGRLERNRALLTPFLVTWAADHADARIRKLTYTYRVFDADTQRRAAELTEDPAERKRLLDAALARFTALDSADNAAAYVAALPPEKRSRARYDPQVKLGLARTAMATADWTTARLQLATLFSDKVLGEGFLTVPDAAGNFERRDNPTYWEALHDLIRCNVSLGQNVEAMKGLLAEQALLYGEDLGGKRWRAAFETLMRELDVRGPTTGPATSPA